MESAERRGSGVEQAVFELRRLFESFGYKKYKMSKFEEYDLYLENKSFLPSAQIITFTDLGGRLLALKPDVTLSIAKNAPCSPAATEKVYYNENVYRTPRGSREYREIAQVGLECLGEIDAYSQCEAVLLACRSLALLSGEFVLALSHMGFVSGLLESCRLPLSLEGRALSLIEHKNAHELSRLCQKAGIEKAERDALAGLTTLHGAFEETVRRARALVRNDAMARALQELEAIFAVLRAQTGGEALTLDFSVLNDLSYYNGLIFQGYIPKVPRAVLSGGRYDNLMEKLGKKTGAIGFAVYVDELERLSESGEDFDTDVLLVYGGDTPPGEIVKAMEDFVSQGKSVRAQRSDDGKLRYRELVRLKDGRK